MSKLNLIFLLLILFASSCFRANGEKCKSILTSEIHFRDSIPSGLEIDDRIYAVSIKLKGKIENDIQLNEFSFPAGNVDILILNRNQDSPTVHFELSNKSGGNVDLDICVGFAYKL